MTSSPTYTATVRQPNLLLRVVYFLLFGLWFSAIWASVAWVLSVTVIGLPVGIWMLNRLPPVTTLHTGTRVLERTSNGNYVVHEQIQRPFIVRAIYFVLVGWWFSALWLSLAWALSATLIGLPFSFWMIDRTPAALTLAR